MTPQAEAMALVRRIARLRGGAARDALRRVRGFGRHVLDTLDKLSRAVTDLSFEVQGTPAPKGSTRSFLHARTGKVVTLPDAKGYEAWNTAVALAARRAMEGLPPMDGPVGVSLTFRLRAPLRLRNPGGRRPATRPDVDKLARAVLDAATQGGVWKDDGQVCSLQVDKFYAGAEQEGVSVRVWALGA